jgi:hypothetical protein
MNLYTFMSQPVFLLKMYLKVMYFDFFSAKALIGACDVV